MGDNIMVTCEECDGAGHCERIAHYGNYGYYAARANRTGDTSPVYEDCECEECGGIGEVEHRCPNCNQSHEVECCEVCDGCETCCTCTCCDGCGEKVPDGERWDKVGEDKLCEKCIEEQHGPWCWEQGQACAEFSVEYCPDAACAHRVQKDEDAAEEVG